MPLNTSSILIRGSRILSIWAVIIVSLWLILESLFFCCISYLFPYAARISFGFGIYPLLQTSKEGTEPKNYIAIFGDSFGFGAGDHFGHVQYQSNPLFNVTHHLHQRMQRDFISFAIPGSSNLCGWIEDPIVSMNYINATWFHHIEQPSEILLYFYEGNDIQDTYRDLQDRYLIGGYQKEKMEDASYFSEFIQKEMLERNQINIKSRQLNAGDNFMLLSYAENAKQEIEKREKFSEFIKSISEKKPKPGETNIAMIKNIATAMPDNLQPPPVEMQKEEISDTLIFIKSITQYVKNEYANSAISIIYIPSTITSYQMISDTVSIYNPGGETQFSTDLARRISNQLCNEIRDIAMTNNMGFYDTRSGITSHGRSNLLHGPFDWGHFNEAGYTALSNEIFNYLNAQESSGIVRTVSPCAIL